MMRRTKVEDKWFVTRALDHGVHLIAEPGHVCSWLITGEKRAMLVDSGMGIASMAALVAGLTDLPIILVNTHYHFDHIGGNHEFTDIAIHALGADQLQRMPRAECLAGYMRWTTDRLQVASRYEQLHQELFEMDTPDELVLRSLPADFDPAKWSIRSSSASTILQDGDIIDLGGRAIRVIHTPGHSPDGISLLDERAGMLFTGDVVQCRAGCVYAHFDDSDPGQLLASVERLSALEGKLHAIFFPHWPWPSTETGLLGDIAVDVRRAVHGELPEVIARDDVGNSMRLACGTACTVSLRDAVPPPSLTVPRDDEPHEGRPS